MTSSNRSMDMDEDNLPAATDSRAQENTPLRGWTRFFVSLGLRILLLTVILYAAILGLLVAFETTLVYPGARDGDWEPQSVEYKPVEFTSGDGTKLHGWYLAADPELPEQKPQLAMLLHHGNGENVTHLIGMADRFRTRHAMAVLIYDYRGFGRSEGSPFESGVLADGEAAMRWLMEQTGLGPQRIIQLGRSLGGGVAVHVAAEFQSGGLILDRTFNSIADVASSRYWMFPVRWVLRNQSLSQEKIANYRGPLLQLHGDADEIIDLRFARKLFAAAASEDKIFIESPGTTHIDAWPTVFTEAADRLIDEIAADATDNASEVADAAVVEPVK